MISEREQMSNLTLLTDYYQITMMYAHFKQGFHNKKVVFDVFFRENPCGSGYTLFSGLEQLIYYINNLKFNEQDIEYLSSVHQFDKEFLDFLSDFKFTGEIWSVEEGTVIFPNEPIIRVKANIIEAHLLETAILNIVNHQTLLATRASRVVYSANGDPVMEFGLRRAQGPDAGVYGARAAYIGGVVGTSNVMAGKMFSIPVMGTHAHAFIQSYPSELDAFIAFADTYPRNATLLVDTYDTLNTGVPNAIKTFKLMKEKYGDNFVNFGIRLDSGDLAYISKKARKMLDDAGFSEAKIVASNDLDEYLIRDLKLQGAKINSWGVGTNLITSSGCSALGGVYKLVAEEEDGVFIPRIKISENPEKITTPGCKKVLRFYDNESNKAILDLIMLEDEQAPEVEFVAFDPTNVWKRKVVKNYYYKDLLLKIFDNGRLIYRNPTLKEIRENATRELNTLSEEIKRLKNPHIYHVDLSKPLWDLKFELIDKNKKG